MTDQPEPAPWTVKGAARALRSQLVALRDAGVSHAITQPGELGELARRDGSKSAPAAPAGRRAAPADRAAVVRHSEVRTGSPGSKPQPVSGGAVVVPSVAAEELQALGGKRAGTLAEAARKVSACDKCGLCTTRTQTVYSRGNPNSPLMIVGEAPGADEDRTGLPFVGRAGQLLDKILSQGMGYDPETVYIANVLKCRPPQNRNPEPSEVEACRKWLEHQIEVVNPEVIIGLGLFAGQWLLGQPERLGAMRGKLWDARGRKVLCTYHPAYLLRNPAANQDVWQDVQLVMDYFGRGKPLVMRG